MSISLSVTTPNGQGSPGVPAQATLGGAGFIQPALGQNVTITVGPPASGAPASTTWMVPGAAVAVQGGGTYTVVSVIGPASAVLQNSGATNTASGTLIAAGAAIGPTGASAQPPATSLAGSFTMPNIGLSATATVGATSWMAVGSYVFLVGAGWLTVTSIVDSAHAVLANPGVTGNAAGGTVIGSGASLIVSGGPGPTGQPFTTTGANFVQPAVNSSVVVQVGSSAWMVAGAFVQVTGGGYYTVSSTGSGLATLTNIGATGNLAPGLTVNSGATVAPAGPFGPPGPLALSVANATALGAQGTTGYFPGTVAFVQSTKTLFYLDPTSVATPDGVNVIAAVGGGNWIALPSALNPGTLGETIVQGLGVEGESAVVGIGIAAAGVQAINLRYNPAGGTQPLQLSRGEFTSCSALVRVKNAASGAISLATNASPIVLTLPQATVSALATGSRVFNSGVGGNTAANTGAYVNILSATTVALYSDAALTQPIAGNGAYTSGGVLQCRDVASFQVRGDFHEIDGSVVTANGSTTGSDTTVPLEPANAGPSLAGVTVSLSVLTTTIQALVSAPTNVPLTADLRCSYSRLPIPGLGQVPVVNQPGTNSGSSDGGGPFTLTGQFFTGATQVTLAGIPATFTFVDDQHLTVTPGAGMPFGGTGDIAVTNGGGTGSVGSSTAWTYTPTWHSITTAGLGMSDVAEFPNTGITQAAGVATGWTDVSGNAQTLANFGSPTYNASSASITPNGPTVTMVSGSDLERSALAIGSNAQFTAMLIWCVCKVTTATTFQELVNVAIGGNVDLRIGGSAGVPELAPTGSITTVDWGSSIQGAGMVSILAYFDNSSVSWISVQNGAQVRGTHAAVGVFGTLNTPSPFAIGQRQAHNSPSTAEFAHVGIATLAAGSADAAITSAVRTAIQAVAHARYGI